MKTSGLMLLVFAFAIGAATFVENDYGTTTAKAYVYSAPWFEFLLFLLGVNLAGNIFMYKMYLREKIPMMLFHVALIIILIGAAISRFTGYEGVLHVREGAVEDTLLSRTNYIQIEVKQGNKRYQFEKPVLLSAVKRDSDGDSIRIGDQTLHVKLKQFLPDAAPVMENAPDGKPMVSFVAALQEGGAKQSFVLEEGKTDFFEGSAIGFNTVAEHPAAIQIIRREGRLLIQAPAEIQKYDMATQKGETLPSNQAHLFEDKKLYSVDGVHLVLREFNPSAKVIYKAQSIKSTPGGDPDILQFGLEYGGESRELIVRGKEGVVGKKSTVTLQDMTVSVLYGPKEIKLPFAIKLRDFQLERYPGSMSPASYASEVTVIDKVQNQEFDYRIFMNHVLDYQGFRFFQASYDRDEKGTILSVNHDFWGTAVTYVGYLLLAIGMFGALFSPKGRMRHLSVKINKLRNKEEITAAALMMALLFALPPVNLHAAETKQYSKEEIVSLMQAIDADHARKFGRVLTQDRGGRVKPVNTLAHEVLNKIARTDNFHGLLPEQVLLGAVVRPNIWQQVKMIKVTHPDIKENIGIDKGAKRAAFLDFFDFARPEGYKLGSRVDEANRKRPAMQDKMDKDLIKVDERVNICYMLFTGELLRMMPKPHDAHATWFSPMAAIENFPEEESNKVRDLITRYFTAVEVGINKKDWTQANSVLNELIEYQKFYGVSIYPSDSRIDMEIMYNEYQIFKNLFPLYGLVGLILLIAAIFHIVKPIFNLNRIFYVALALLGLGFLIHTAGLGLRWYISGHAPWSDGYESMIYIAWATLLAGFLFARGNAIVMAATGILASVILFSAHLSWMDPQITNLVPVLNSYWLIIHVSMITASYGFLGLGALIGFITLILYILMTKEKKKKMDRSISELTYINEMSLMFGLILLTIGNFLGGVWANESWGRYWGWDPKETWALVTILVYAFVIHMRFIPALKEKFTLNVASVVAFGTVLMTYFGVNFYLSGLHSYAKGDPVPIPTWVYVTVLTVLVTILLAWRNKRVVGSS